MAYGGKPELERKYVHSINEDMRHAILDSEPLFPEDVWDQLPILSLHGQKSQQQRKRKKKIQSDQVLPVTLEACKIAITPTTRKQIIEAPNYHYWMIFHSWPAMGTNLVISQYDGAEETSENPQNGTGSRAHGPPSKPIQIAESQVNG